MSEFKNITLTREAKIYFNGKVTSRTIVFADDTVKTLGIMMTGDYTFETEKPEMMEILSGQLTYCLKESNNWIDVKGGEAFNVPGDSSFDLKVTELTDYCCSYID